MSAILESRLDAARRIECARNDLAALDKLRAEQRERDCKEGMLRQLFAGALRDVTQPAVFAWRPQGRVRPVHEVMMDVLQMGGWEPRAMQILANAAAGRASQRDAQQLLDDMMAAFARDEVEL